jgi:thioredoxin reductase (NADPH)
VTIIHRRDTLRASKSYAEPLKNAGNVEFILNAQIEGILRNDDNGFKGLTLTDKGTGKKRSFFATACLLL